VSVDAFRRIRGAAGDLLFIQFKFAADFGSGCGVSSVLPPNAKQERQLLGFSDRRVIGSPQQTQMRGPFSDLAFIGSSPKKYMSKILS
jgi:hypothetical protein